MDKGYFEYECWLLQLLLPLTYDKRKTSEQKNETGLSRYTFTIFAKITNCDSQFSQIRNWVNCGFLRVRNSANNTIEFWALFTTPWA